MPSQLGMMAAETGQNIVNTGMGLLLSGWNDRRQLKQQGKLQALEIQGQNQMAEANLQRQMRLWEMTNYKAQMEQLKKAGLNLRVS